MLIAFVASSVAWAKPVGERGGELLSEGWRFQISPTLIEGEQPELDDSAWAAVQIPHTWSGPNGKPTTANAWYRTRFSLKNKAEGERVYLYFEGVATAMNVYVDGHFLGTHRGAYTAAIFDATDALDSADKSEGADHLLAIRVSNDPHDTSDCLPCAAPGAKELYHIYGGIYRKVWLLKTPGLHIYPELASSGVFVSQGVVNGDHAELSIRTAVRHSLAKINRAAAAQTITVKHLVRDAEGKEVASFEGSLAVEQGRPTSSIIKGEISKPHLWSVKDPYLYTVETQLIDGGKTVDSVTETIGLRTLVLDPEKGFFLNGQPILLRGVNKHQETEYSLTAVNDDALREDWDNLVDLGVNCVRLPHYPHARLEYDLADKLGILIWAENGHSNKNGPTGTGELITREMVRQNFNHPSIVFWSCGNETGEEETASTYAKVIHEEDTGRLVTYGSDARAPLESRFHGMEHLSLLVFERYLPRWRYQDRWG